MRQGPFLLAMGGKMPRKASGPARHRQAVVTVQTQAILQEIIDMAGKSAITAKHRRRPAQLAIERQSAPETGRGRFGCVAHSHDPDYMGLIDLEQGFFWKNAAGMPDHCRITYIASGGK
jgi:hypothetical protein